MYSRENRKHLIRGPACNVRNLILRHNKLHLSEYKLVFFSHFVLVINLTSLTTARLERVYETILA